MFLLKKFLSGWLMPLPFCLMLLVIGLWLTSTSKRKNPGRFFLTSGVILLLLFSNRFVSTWLIRPLESTYPPIPELVTGASLPMELIGCRTVVVLGGGHGDTPSLAAIDKLSSSSRARLTEGVRLLRVLPEAKLVVTGGGAPNQPSHAAVQAEAAISLGVAPNRIVRLETPRDTEEEAEALSRALGQESFALVTSASHLRRATALMRNRGLHPVPCPCDYTSRPEAILTWADFMWDTESLGRSTWAVYERLGFTWSQMRGKI
jgi:uncharacterized SAM-binding protein YcdF (DUF218 family)